MGASTGVCREVSRWSSSSWSDKSASGAYLLREEISSLVLFLVLFSLIGVTNDDDFTVTPPQSGMAKITS
jgi:hypothetical protein